jgi:adenosylcobinamide amidohydrolase
LGPGRVQWAFGKAVDLDFYRQQPDEVAQLLHDAGFQPWSTIVKQPEEMEKTRRAS